MSYVPAKTYLGDGAYARTGDYRGEIILTTENGISIQNEVHLGPSEVETLLAFLSMEGYFEIMSMLVNKGRRLQDDD